MNARCGLLLSLGLNLALALLLAWAARHPAPRASADRIEPPVPHRFVRVRPARTLAPAATVIEVQGRFHWSEVESPDYLVYVANLRAIGCPERTIRDLIAADVNAWFAGRVRELVDAVHGRFWELMLDEEELDGLVDAKQEELEQLGKERERVFKAVLGTSNPARDVVDAEAEAGRALERNQMLDFLPPEKAQAFVGMQERYKAMVAAVLAEGNVATPSEKQARSAKLSAIRQQEQAEQQALLTPQELEELTLRRFAAGQNTRFAYDGLPLTAEDTRALAAAELRQTLAAADLPVKSSERKAAVAAAKQQAEAERRQVLGEGRFADWQRSQQPDYQLLTRVSERLDLPAEAAVQAYALGSQAFAQAAALRENATLAPDSKKELLRLLEAETRQALRTTLGDRGFQVYRDNTELWEGHFGRSPPNF
jgi:hypothetical protein